MRDEGESHSSRLRSPLGIPCVHIRNDCRSRANCRYSAGHCSSAGTRATASARIRSLRRRCASTRTVLRPGWPRRRNGARPRAGQQLNPLDKTGEVRTSASKGTKDHSSSSTFPHFVQVRLVPQRAAAVRDEPQSDTAPGPRLAGHGTGVPAEEIGGPTSLVDFELAVEPYIRGRVPHHHAECARLDHGFQAAVQHGQILPRKVKLDRFRLTRFQ